MFAACSAPCAQEAIRPVQQLPGAALRPPGSICAAMLSLPPATACSRSRLLSWHGNSPHSQPVASGAASLHPHAAAFGAFSGSMPPGCAASLRYMPLTRYECYGRPHNPVHYFRSELRLSQHGNSLHPHPAAPAHHTAMQSALNGSVCAAFLSLSLQQPAFAFSCIPLIPASATHQP